MPQMSPIDWANRPLQKYADFSGRAPRAEFWWYTLAVIVAAIIAMVIERTLGFGRLFLEYVPLTMLIVLGTFIPSLAVQVRRLHDTNKPGWWLLAMYVPYAVLLLMTPGMTGGAMAGTAPSGGSIAVFGLLGLVILVMAIVLLVFYVLPGTRGPNNYGPDPYGDDVEKVFA
jgi:uncharacterized membrane protein YhaH (DUF805 family)